MGTRRKLTIKEFRNRKRKGLRNNMLKRSTTKSFNRPDAFKFENEEVVTEEPKVEAPVEEVKEEVKAEVVEEASEEKAEEEAPKE